MATRWRWPPDSVMPSRPPACHSPREQQDVVVDGGQAGRVFDLRARGVGAGQRDVVRNRGGEQEGLLRHPADGGAQRLQLVLVERVAAPCTLPCCGVSWRSSTRSSVDLPLPVGPTRPRVWPGCSVSVISLMAGALCSA
jgi:hypothetical protein